MSDDLKLYRVYYFCGGVQLVPSQLSVSDLKYELAKSGRIVKCIVIEDEAQSTNNQIKE